MESTKNTDKEVVIVSGSSGLIGTALINKLAKNYQIVGLDNVGYPFPSREEYTSFSHNHKN